MMLLKPAAIVAVLLCTPLQGATEESASPSDSMLLKLLSEELAYARDHLTMPDGTKTEETWDEE